LSLKDIQNVIFLNKSIFKNIDRKSLNYIVKNIASKLIIKNIKSFTFYLKNINVNNNNFIDNIFKNAVYFYKYYPKRFINEYYNMNTQNNIIEICKEKYNLKITDNPSRYDLFNLVKNLNFNDLLFLGW
jgi:hypothetical protein